MERLGEREGLPAKISDAGSLYGHPNRSAFALEVLGKLVMERGEPRRQLESRVLGLCFSLFEFGGEINLDDGTAYLAVR